ncbi:MAG: hypothetical protein AB1894_09875 [Chloroflexota bacterium]
MHHKVRRTVLLLIYILLAGLLGTASFWLLFNAATGFGRGAALAGLSLASLPGCLYLGNRPCRGQRAWKTASILLGLWVLAAGAGLLLAAPPGQSRPGAPVSQYWSSGGSFQRYALANLAPEAEQVNLGFQVMPYLDPLFTPQQAQRVSQFTLALYREMDRQPDFRRLGSALGYAYTDWLGQPFEAGHYFLYVPANHPEGLLPAILFLHGSAGSFKAYTWAWAKLAESQGYVIIAPSFGFGDWRQVAGEQAALAALEDAQKHAPIDMQRVYLAGLSNGGLGVSLLADHAPKLFRGLIWLSPVIATEVISSSAFQRKWAGRSVLVLTGAADERVPVGYVEEQVQRMRAGGVYVTYYAYPGEDHFLFFARLEEVLDKIAHWLDQLDQE